jgi:hypothetical protein
VETGEFKVSFLRKTAVDLADNEKVSLWEPARSGTVRLDKDGIKLNGNWRVSAIGKFLGSGLLGELFIKPFFLKERAETIPVQNLERALVYQKKKNVTFHLFQTRDQGMVEVHVFMVDKNVLPQVLDALKIVVPANQLKEQNVS